jgi:hypothetical protein
MATEEGRLDAQVAKMLESIRVNVRYRPLRIAWAIRAGDLQSFRSAVRISNTLWGGRFNPIIIVDEQVPADDLKSTEAWQCGRELMRKSGSSVNRGPAKAS